MVLLALAIASGAFVANIAILHVAEEGRSAEALLLQLQVSAHRMSALEWQAIGNQEISPELARHTQDTQGRMGRAMASLEQSDPNAADLRLLRQSYDAYTLAMNEEFRLIKAGDLAQAQVVDDDLGDPAFDALAQALTSAGAMYRTKVTRLEQLALLGSTAVLLLAMAAISALVWRTQKALAAAEEASARERTADRTQQVALESRDHFRKMVEHIPLSMALVGLDGTIEYINSKSVETFGYLAQDIPNMDRWWVQAYPDETYRAQVVALWGGLLGEALAHECEIKRREYRVTCKNGSVKVVMIFGVWIGDKVLVVFEDITKRKKAVATQEQLAAIVESSNDAIYSRALDGTILSWNPGAEKVLGYTAAEAIGKPGTFNLPPGLHPNMARNTETILRGETILARESKRLTKDGRVIDVLTSHSPVRDSAGKIIGASVFLQDITERKQARERRDQLAAIIKSSNDAIYSRALDGTILSWNSGAEKMFGYTAAEAIGKSTASLMPPGKPRERAQKNEKILRGEIVERREATRLTKDGRVIDVMVSNSPVKDSAGKVIGASAYLQDITERKHAEAERARLEAQLRESQKMEALGTLAGGVAHDFNNALAMIVGNVELARQDVGPGHPALESLEEIAKASRRSKDLVQQILAFARRQTLDRKPTSLSMVVLESARLLRASLPAKVSLNVDCKAGTPAVLADAAQVNQILLNLCSNAAHAVESQARPGVIEVRLEACTLGEARGNLRPGRYACLTVRDNGTGMDEATRSRLFEPFFTTKPVGKGTGLGLSVVHGIVQAHEASIEVDSTPGEGTTFRIYFPAIEVSISVIAAPAPDTALVRGTCKHILYVDDEEGLVHLMKRLLLRQGFRFTGHTDPREALEAVRANPDLFDLVVTDYNMPYLSGLEVVQALKDIRADLPVVLASGYITEELRAKAPAAGIRELIYKPNTVDDLCEAIVRYANAQTVGEPSKPS